MAWNSQIEKSHDNILIVFQRKWIFHREYSNRTKFLWVDVVDERHNQTISKLWKDLPVRRFHPEKKQLCLKILEYSQFKKDANQYPGVRVREESFGISDKVFRML